MERTKESSPPTSDSAKQTDASREALARSVEKMWRMAGLERMSTGRRILNAVAGVLIGSMMLLFGAGGFIRMSNPFTVPAIFFTVGSFLGGILVLIFAAITFRTGKNPEFVLKSVGGGGKTDTYARAALMALWIVTGILGMFFLWYCLSTWLMGWMS